MTLQDSNRLARLTERFGAEGYLLVRSILDRTVLQEVHHLLITARDRVNGALEQWTGEPVSTDAAFVRHQRQLQHYEAAGLPADLRHYLVGEFDLQTRLDLRICSILSALRVRSFLTGFLGASHFYVHYPPMIRFKISDAPGSILPPHQDFAYNRHLRDFVTVWVPLVDIDSHTGGLVLYEGSHLAGFLEHGAKGPWAYGVQSAPSPKYHKCAVEMEFGDALIFPPFLLHESAPHLSDRTRYSIDFRVFLSPEDTGKSYFDPFSNLVVRSDIDG